MYKKLFSYLAIVTALVTIAFFINSCSDVPISPQHTQGPQMLTAGNGCDSANVFCGSPGTIEIQNPCPGTVQTIDLWTGVGNATAGALVGHVQLTPVSGNTWTVTYNFIGSTASEIHFAIACTRDGIPHTRNGNPIPGQFPYNFSGLNNVSTYSFNITLPTGCTCFYVAAHAVVTLTGLTNFESLIPTGCVNLQVNGGWTSGNGADTGCYWQFTLSNAGAFNGLFCGWCIDLAHGMPPSGGPFTCARIFSSLSPLLPCDTGYPWIDHPENFPAVNYIINTYAPGQTVNLTNSDCSLAGGTGNLTVIDIQKAIWTLLDQGPGNDYNEFSNPLRVNAIVCDARNHNNFVPNCANGDKIVFVVFPDGPCNFTVQPIIGFLPCSTGGSGTAWGDGKYGGNFPGSNWATYFIWCPTCP